VEDIRHGVLPGGAKLPTVRALAELNGLSVGTVRQAYDTLERQGYIEKSQGRGSFVRHVDPGSPSSRKQQALAAIGRAFDEILALGLSPREARIFFDLKLRELEDMGPVLRIGVIDCSPEALVEIYSQIAPLSNVEVYSYLLQDILAVPERLGPGLDLLLTTNTHFTQLSGHLGPERPLIAVALTLWADTAVSLSRIPRDAQVGILCKSPRFGEIILGACLKYCRLDRPPKTLFWGSLHETTRFLGEIDSLILPRGYQTLCPPEELSLINAHPQPLLYRYEMDQGSLLTLTDQLRQLLKSRAEA